MLVADIRLFGCSSGSAERGRTLAKAA